jgi:Ca2+-binding EF-hand superfamily protein
MNRKSVLLAALVTLAPAALLAADGTPNATRGPRGEGDLFARFDTNKDGALSKDEVANAGHLAKSFDKLDANHDGLISKDEMQAAGEERRAEMKAEAVERFKAADKNADGLLSKEEVSAGMPRLARRFDLLDANKDGTLSPEELAAAREHFGRRAGR